MGKTMEESNPESDLNFRQTKQYGSPSRVINKRPNGNGNTTWGETGATEPKQVAALYILWYSEHQY